MAIAHESVKGRNVNSDEMWELSPHRIHKMNLGNAKADVTESDFVI
nr:MAG TPA: hypothetical protein [Caudoviricetes sp.]